MFRSHAHDLNQCPPLGTNRGPGQSETMTLNDGWRRGVSLVSRLVRYAKKALPKATRNIAGLCSLALGSAAFAQGPIANNLPDPSSLQLKRGIVVEHVSRDGAAAKAGLLAGDLLLRWKRGKAEGQFDSPFEIPFIFFDQSPKGPITLIGNRRATQRAWVIGSDAWDFVARPNFSMPLLSLYRDGEKALDVKDWANAVEIFRKAATASLPLQSHWLAGWLLSRPGKALLAAQKWDLFDAVCKDAIDQTTEAGPMVRGELFRLWAEGFERRDNLDSAEHYYDQALQEYQKLGHGTLAESTALGLLAVVELNRGKFDIAEENLLQAMGIGTSLAPASPQTITIIADLAVMYQDRGQLKDAETYYFKAKDLEEKYFPRSIHLARTLENLGVLFDQEGDLIRSEAYERRALEIAESLAGEDWDVGDILAKLADCLLEQGKLRGAANYEIRAVAIRQKLAPNGLGMAYSLATTGKIARARGDLTKAEYDYKAALSKAINIEAPPIDQATFLIGWAAVLRDARDFAGAENLYRRSLDILEKEEPGSIDTASTLADLAGIVYSRNRPDEAKRLYSLALNAFEAQTTHLGYLEETQSRFRSEHLHYYQEYMDVLLSEGQAEQAFNILEDSRARTLLGLLTQAHVDLDSRADPALRQRRHRLQGLLNAESEYRLRAVALSQEAIKEVDSRSQQLLVELQEVEAQMRASDPVALDDAKPLKAPEVQKLLDSNTLLLEYSLGAEKSYVWAVSDQSLEVYQLPKRSEIENAARRVYRFLTARNSHTKSAGWDKSAAECRVASRRLALILLGPVRHLLGEKRLVIVAAGGLQYIPFAALPDPEDAGTVPLMLKHEIVNLPSASVLGVIRRERLSRPRAPYSVAVLADPVFDADDDRLRSGAKPTTVGISKLALEDRSLTRSAQDLGLTRDGKSYFSRLLYTRNEAEAVTLASQPGRVLSALDFDASRALAMNGTLGKYRIVHFATHGILNNKHPELSGLVLSLVNKRGQPQEGFLKTKDIYSLKLSADLVVLSGCETGLGEQIDGEGIVGLTRAFMYAGANRVVASLWRVSDMATADFMGDFYKAMDRDHMRPAAALRAAQIKMWRRKQWTDPYFWAAFQIQGDWQ